MKVDIAIGQLYDQLRKSRKLKKLDVKIAISARLTSLIRDYGVVEQ